MQSQIREDLNGSTYSLSAPPGHLQQQQYAYQAGGSQPAYQVVHHPAPSAMAYDNSGSLAHATAEHKRPTEKLRHFSSRFSGNTSYNPSFRSQSESGTHHSSLANGPGTEGYISGEEPKMRGDYKRGIFRGTAQMDWVDKLREHPRFALYVFLGLNAAMLLVIFLTAMIWIALGIVKSKKFLSGIPPPANVPINNP
jgi:hypothetical protein